MVTGRIYGWESLGSVDGPGLRTVIYMQGCPLRCRYCHNPETWTQGEIWESDAVLSRLERFRPYWGRGGGVTLSGGEPLAQPQFAREILRGAKERGIHTALDTSGWGELAWAREILDWVDLVILDIKASGEEAHQWLTGRSQDPVLDFLEVVREREIPLWVRQVIMPGWNDTADQVDRLAQMVSGVPSLRQVELLPYHTQGISKWEFLGISYPLAGVEAADVQKVSSLQARVNQLLGL